MSKLQRVAAAALFFGFVVGALVGFSARHPADHVKPASFSERFGSWICDYKACAPIPTDGIYRPKSSREIAL